MRSLTLLAAFALASGCSPEAGGNGAAEPQATVRLPAVPGHPGAAYLELPASRIHGDLVAVTSPQVGRIEIHETTNHEGMTGMRGVQQVWAQPGQPMVFEPGGRHLMLFDISPAVRPGSNVELVFRYQQGPPETVTARAVPAGG
jgi:copper(I)-binding protein